MTRVAGIDPGTVSFDICVLEDGAVVSVAELPTSDLEAEPGRLARILAREGPLDGAVGPSGYGLPLCRLADLDEARIRLAFLSEQGETGGIRGLVPAMRALRAADVPVWVVPGVVHLPTVPEHRKVNRIDMGTADKVCAAALAVARQADRRGCPPTETDFLLVELGGAFTSVLSVRSGAVVDGIGGSSGPPGVRGPGALDGEVAVVVRTVTKRHVFSGGAAAVAAGRPPAGTVKPERASSRRDDPGDEPTEGDEVDPAADGPAAWAEAGGAPGTAWRHLMEGAEKGCRSLLAVHPEPREILLSGRHGTQPAVVERLSEALAPVAPVRPLEGITDAVSAAAQGAALLADGLAGGEHRALPEVLRLREAAGTVFDHLYLEGAAEAAARWLEA